MITYLINYSSGDTGVELSFRYSGKDGIYPSVESWLSLFYFILFYFILFDFYFFYFILASAKTKNFIQEL